MLKVTRRSGLRWRYLSLVVLAIALSACAGTKDNRDRSYVYQSDDNFVRLDPIEPGAPANSHPFAISADQLRQLLAGIKVSGAASIGKVPAFSKEELETIVPPLGSALSKAGPNQDVTFAVTSRRGMFGGLSPKSITTGRLFVSGDSVNLIFGLMQERLDGATLDYSAVAPEITPGARARRIGNTVWKIEPGSGHFHEQRGDWLVFDRSVMPAAAPIPATPPAPDADAKSGGDAAAAPTIDSKVREIENRLRLLDALRKKGAITEQEYLERRRAILEQL